MNIMEVDQHDKIADINLFGYKHITVKKDNCDVFIKGVLSILQGNRNFEQWINSLIIELANIYTQSCSYICSQLFNTTGLFSLIIRIGNDYYIISDIIRSYPVFYGFLDNNLFITNNLNEFQIQNGTQLIDNNKLEEFVASGFVYGNGTIFKNIYALQAGEVVAVEDSKIRSERYFKFKPVEKPIYQKNLTEFTKTFDQVLLSVFSRMIEQTPNVNRWVVPLSGGHDSRTIVNYLYRLGLRNVVCYSYGTFGNEQSRLSRQVAGALGYEWHFVDYTALKWQNLHEMGIMDKYINYSFNGVSTPHFQDFLAIYELKEKGIVKQNDTFIPGHAFDFLVGSNLDQTDILCKNKSMTVERVFLMHSKIKSWSASPVRTIEDIYEKAMLDPQHFREYFNWQELRAKFLINSVRGYEFFDFDFRLPFWDKVIVDFWLRVPDNERMGRKIFLEAEKQGILVEQLLSIPFFGKSDRTSDNKIEDLFRNLLPSFVKTAVLRLTSRKVKYNAGLNQIYELRASTVKKLLEPIEDFPYQIRSYFKDFLNRYPHQVDYHFLTSLYTIRKQLDKTGI